VDARADSKPTPILSSDMSSELSRLYDLADELNCLGPWNWMDEVQLIALRHPTVGEMAYLSVMGAAGEHRSLTLYLGEEALHRFNLIHEAEFMDIKLSDADLAGLILEARQLQVSFETRRALEKADLDQIKKLGRKYRGEEWPMFRSFRPGRAPGPVDDLEADWLFHGLTQILEVAPRLGSGAVEDSRRTPRFQILGRERDKAGQWRDFWIDFDDSLHDFPSPECDPELIRSVLALPKRGELQVAFELLPVPIGPRFGERTFPYMLLCVDSKLGTINGMEMLTVEDSSYPELIASVPDTLLRLWERNGARPSAVRATSLRTCLLLGELAEALETPVYRHDNLPALDAALRSMKQAFLR
jgi:hypothetical protein